MSLIDPLCFMYMRKNQCLCNTCEKVIFCLQKVWIFLYSCLKIEKYSPFLFLHIIPMSQFKVKKISPVSHEKNNTSVNIEKKSMSQKKLWSIILWVFAIGCVTVFGWNMFQKMTNLSYLVKGATSQSGSEPEYVNVRPVEQVNILLAGIGWKWHQGDKLTDTLILASLDGEKKKITLLSLPRDLYISLPRWGAGRINEIYANSTNTSSGIEDLKTKVTEITGESIDYYFIIDFQWFIDIVNILWGIEVDVPRDLVDREYPDDNYGYEVFSIAKWLQTLDGATALKYARSRHSTSDFSRSERQQLIIEAIKEKVFSLWYLTNPNKIMETWDAVASHIHTDLSPTEIINLAVHVNDVPRENMFSFNINSLCGNIKNCVPWSYLYTPSRELFGGASVLIPENSALSKISYYNDIRLFSAIIFRYGEISKMIGNIHIVNNSKVNLAGYGAAIGLRKLGFPIAQSGTIVNGSGILERSYIHIFWDEATQTGIDPKSTLILALKKALPALEIVASPENMYVKNDGPKIEIILGRDYRSTLPLSKLPSYIPITQWVKNTTQTSSTSHTKTWDSWIGTGNTTGNIKKSLPKKNPVPPTEVKPRVTAPTSTEWDTTNTNAQSTESYIESIQNIDPNSLPIQ